MYNAHCIRLYAPRQCLGVRVQRLVDVCVYRIGKDLLTTINSQSVNSDGDDTMTTTRRRGEGRRGRRERERERETCYIIVCYAVVRVVSEGYVRVGRVNSY